VLARAGESADAAAARATQDATHVEDSERGEYAEAVCEALKQKRLEDIMGFRLDGLNSDDGSEYDDGDSDVAPPSEPASPAKMPHPLSSDSDR